MLDPKSHWKKDTTFSVLNGIYPTRAIKRMTKTKLARLIYNLVQYTASIVGNKNKNNGLIRPVWWPNGIVFNNNLSLPNVISQKEMKVTLEQLVKCCTQFFKTTEIGYYVQEMSVKSRIRTRNQRKSLPYSSLVSSINKERLKKRQFLMNCGLQQKTSTTCHKVKNINNISTPKLMNTTFINIPFSSDIGRLLIRKNNCQISEQIQLKRIEKSEWYINRSDKTPIDIEYQIRPNPKEIDLNYHTYKIPKRQFHQQQPGFHDAKFLQLFCKPVSVVLERLDVKKLTNNSVNQCVNSNGSTIGLCDKKIPIVLLNDITNTELYCSK